MKILENYIINFLIMSKNFITTNEKSIYLDTSFIIYSLVDSIDRDINISEMAINMIWLLYTYKSDNCYISNIVLSELYHALERSWFQYYIDEQIIKKLSIDKTIWKNYKKTEREKFRYENMESIWLTLKDIKKWRYPEFENIYKILVTDEFENIIASLPPWIKIISNFSSEESILDKFKKIKKKYHKLDSNDVNHYLLCKEHNIDWILTCDNDFNEINDENLEVIILNKKFKNLQI